VRANPEQPRSEFDDTELAALTESIRLHGVLQPIVVEAVPGGHQLVAGERRLRATQRAGLGSIPAIVRPATESARQALELALTENLLRAELSPLDEATAYTRLSDTFGLTHEAIALRLGRSRAAVTNVMRLLNLPPEIQTSLREGRLTAGHGRALLGLEDPAERSALGAEAAHRAMSVREVEERVAARRNAPSASTAQARRKAKPAAVRTPDEVALERALENALGAPIHIERTGARGRLVIEFFSDDELHGLYERLGGAPL